MGVGVAEQTAVAIEQPVVDRPRVDADTVQRAASCDRADSGEHFTIDAEHVPVQRPADGHCRVREPMHLPDRDRKSTRLNSSHVAISYAVFCLKKKKQTTIKQ